VSSRLKAVAAETVAIVRQGGYRTHAGRWVELTQAVQTAVAGTRLIQPDEPLSLPGHHNTTPTVEVTNESALTAAQRLGEDVCCLVFASARNPGGGFLTGAKAQEEDIARASALHACLSTVPAFYAHHRTDRDLRYSDRIIYSTAVPVFRDDAARLLDEPYRSSMITAAAPNLHAIRQNQPHLAASVPTVLRARTLRVLQVAAAHGHRRLVLGAWGCGVFGNDPDTVAEAFAVALYDVDRFDHVAFAVLDRSGDAATYHAFAARLGARTRSGVEGHP
jgi:uncharacterized protein (TIGR02452 family)